MKVEITVEPNLRQIMAEELEAGEIAVTRAMGKASLRLKQEWRGQIQRAGLGRRLSNSIRSEAYPQSDVSLDAAARVWSNAPQIIDAFESGVTIRSPRGLYLAIPTAAAPKSSKGGRISPAEFQRRTGLELQFVFRRNGPSLLVAEGRLSTGKRTSGRFRESRSKTGRGRTTVPIFILVPQVRLSKRLDLMAAAQRAIAAVPQLIVDTWAQQPSRKGGR